MRKKFSNQEIFNYAEALTKTFLEDSKDIQLPVKVNFYLQKNIKTFITAAQEIEDARLTIGKKYGTINIEKDAYFISDPEKLEQAQQEIKQLLSIDQILEVYMISLEDLQDVKLTVAQMNAMLFMIDEEEKEIW